MDTNCKICHSQTTRIERRFRKRADSKYYRYCPHCEFVFLEKQYLITPETEFEIYESHENSVDDPKYRAFFLKFIKAAILDYTPKEGIKCLDFGSGPEPVLASVLEQTQNWSVDIYDKFYSPEKIYTGKTYDLITCTEVAEHLDDPLHYFSLFKKLLVPGGLLSVMTLFHPGMASFSKWFYINDASHISFYSVKTMATIADLVGLNMIYCDHNRYITFRG